MTRYEKLFDRILRGLSDKDIPFDELCSLLIRMGFDERMRGSHHLFSKPGIREMINLQKDGHLAKPYQIRQVRNMMIHYKLEVK